MSFWYSPAGEKGTISCPFHGWEFEASGQCVAIPYSSAPVPALAKTRSWTVRVHFDTAVVVWFDAEGRAPLYELHIPSELRDRASSGWRVHGFSATQFQMHITEMAENSADYYHFNRIHRPMPLPLVGRFLEIEHVTKRGDDGHVCYADEWATVFLKVPLFGTRFKLPIPLARTRVTFEGPSLVHFQIFTELGEIRMLNALLPVKPFELHTETTWFAAPTVPAWLVRIVSAIAQGALEQDRPLWETKSYIKRPFLVKGDGPFNAHRAWFTQFYSEHSADAAKNLMEW